MRWRISRWKHDLAFNRIELIVVIGVFCVLALIFTTAATSQNKIAQCAANLKQLGAAMSLYAGDNDDRLPYAWITHRGYTTWDTLIFPYFKNGNDAISSSSMKSNWVSILKCPADTLAAVSDTKKPKPRRTYSMPAHSMEAKDWPPGPNNNCGVGLWWWEHGTGLNAATNIFPAAEMKEAVTNEPPRPPLPAIRIKMIPAPSRTLLLTEQAKSNNLAGGFKLATIRSVRDHVDTRQIQFERYHEGKINYLMVDGHVETLTPPQSMGLKDPAAGSDAKSLGNIWTIRADD